MSEGIIEAPHEVALVYRQVGQSHVFTSKSAAGLHIGSKSLRTAFDYALVGLSEHFTKLYGREVRYVSDMGFEKFESRFCGGDGGLADSVVFARLAA